MADSVLWWSALTAGSLLLTAPGVASTIRGSGGRRVPRLGFFPPRPSRPPRWAMAAVFFGILLMTLAAGRLSESDGSYFAYFGGAAAASLAAQGLVGWWHNRRRSPDPGRGALPDQPAGLRDT